MRKGLIYSLIDPRDNLVKYVGQTISNINKRYNQHLVDYKRRVCKVNSWIKSLSDIELKPIIEIIEEDIDRNQLDKKEITYIALFKSVGANLKNHTIGGQGHLGQKMSEKAKQKRKITNKLSERMKEKHKNHSLFMKEAIKSGKLPNPVTYVSRESRKKQGESLKLFRQSHPNAYDNVANSRRKSVISMDLDGNELMHFKSVKDTAEYYGFSNSGIADTCRGLYKQCRGFKFKYG